MLKGQGKISRREALIFFPTRLQRENAMIIINVTIRYTLPTSLWTANAVIIINVAIGYILPTRLQRANAVIVMKCNRQVYSTHEVTKRKCNDYY